MASIPRARVNNLNDRAKDFGIPDRLTLDDVRAVSAFYDFTCLKCGANPAISVDHVIPLSRGGANKRENLQNLCESCNKGKGADDSDYRAGNICPDDFMPAEQEPQSAKSYRKHDWDEMEYQYIHESKSIPELARLHHVSQSNVEARSVRHHWVEKRKQFRGELGESVLAEAFSEAKDKTLDSLQETMSVLRAAIDRWEDDGSKANFRDIVEGLKFLGAMQGKPTERVAHVEPEPDESAIYARIRKAFDPGEEERTYTPLGPAGGEPGAGYSDSI